MAHVHLQLHCWRRASLQFAKSPTAIGHVYRSSMVLQSRQLLLHHEPSTSTDPWSHSRTSAYCHNQTRNFHSSSNCFHATRHSVFTSVASSVDAINKMSDKEIDNLKIALGQVVESLDEEGAVPPPTPKQLRLLCYQNALPFIGFGFIDNFVMIVAGEYIDWTIGMTLGISTMAAAGLGNMISDLAGMGLADQVEAACRALGIPNPNLSHAQMNYKSTRWIGLLGRCVGIVIGCTIGMAPLLWIEKPHKDTCPDHSNSEVQDNKE